LRDIPPHGSRRFGDPVGIAWIAAVCHRVKAPKGQHKPGVLLTAVVREFIADTITPISAYATVGQPGASCLLETVDGAGRMARFSFIGLDYLETATFDDDPNVLDRMREIVGRYDVVDKDRVPFPCGIVCAFSYDAARMLEKIGPRPPADVRFPDAYIAVPGTWIVFDHLTHRVALIALARNDQERSVAEDRLDAYVVHLLEAAPTVPGRVSAVGEARASIDQATFLARVAEAQRFIAEGDAYQLQLGVRFSCALDGTPFDFYRQIRARNPSPYMFYVETPQGALFGASPEFLVRLDGRTARLRPLAGTRPRGETAERDAAIAAELLADEKERAEHVMLVDLGRNDLGAVCRTGTVRVDELMGIERYSHVMHIVSNVIGELRSDKDAFDLFAAAFPAGTVTGAPKIRAMQIIDRLEPLARNFYAGSIVHVDLLGHMDSCIVLRSVAAVDGRAYWQASAGIVADSEPHAEYAEIFAKTRIIRDVLGLRS